MNNRIKFIFVILGLTLGVFHAWSQTSVVDTVYSKRTVVVIDTVFIRHTVVDSVRVSPSMPEPALDAVDVRPGNFNSLTVGDTLLLNPAAIEAIQRNKKIEPFDNDIESSVFIPKGQWLFGVSFSYSQSNQDRFQFFIVEDISANTYSFKVSPMVAYAFKNDMAAGGKFSYTRSLAKLSNTDLVIDSETEMNMDHVYSLSHNYYFTALFRNYFSLGASQRFGFFNEVQLELGGSQSKLTKGVGNSLTGTYERNFSLDIGLVPGLIMFLSNYSAIEVNVGVLGFSYRHTNSISDRIYHSHRRAASANFRINLFSITFGTTFYI